MKNRHPLVQEFVDIMEDTMNNPEQEIQVIALERLQYLMQKPSASKSEIKALMKTWKSRLKEIK